MSFASEFLHDADAVEADVSPWGNESLGIVVAGEVMLAEGLTQAQVDVVRRQLAGFCGDPPKASDAVARILVKRADPAAWKTFDMRGWEYVLALDHTQSAVRVGGLHLAARMEPTSLSTTLWTPAIAGHDFHGAFENLLRIVAAYRLLARGGVLLHSAGVGIDNRATLFVGRAGDGKSTLSRRFAAAGFEILSDDLNACVPSEGGWHVLPVPFAGDFREGRGTARGWPLHTVERLAKDTMDAHGPLGLGARLAAICACSPYVNQDEFRRDQLLQNLADLCADARGGLVHFAADGALGPALMSEVARVA